MELKKEYCDERTGIHYTLGEDELYYPNFVLPEREKVWVGKYGLMRKRYLLEHKKVIYANLGLSGELDKHLLAVNEQAQARVETLMAAMAKADGCDEALKARDQMRWVGLMNNYKACAEEVVLREIVYV